MGVVTGYNAARMKEIEDTTVVSGLVDVNGDLILSQRDGTPMNAGNVIGPPGEKGADGAEGSGLPAGAILAWAASTIPVNYLECNGQAVSRTTYSDLFAIIGTTYGAGDGVTTFNVPDLRGRVIVGLDSTQTEFNALGKTGGAKTHTLTVAEMPSHTHTGTPTNGGIVLNSYNNAGSGDRADSGFVGSGGLYNVWGALNSTGGGGAHNNLQPYGTEKYIIKAIGGVGALSSTVESVLLGRVAKVEESSWELAVASSIASTGATATLDTATGIVTLPTGTTSVRLDGLIAPGYEYEVSLQLSVQSGHATDNSVWMRLCEGGVPNVIASYNSAGLWSQYNGTWGVYTVSGGSAMAIGAVSGASSYVDWVCHLHLMPGFDNPKIAYMSSRSMTSGSARHTDAGHYTPAATTQFDGILFFFNGAGTGPARGKIYVKKRRLLA